MKAMLFAALVGFLIFITPVFAVNVTVSVGKTKVSLGENFTISGTITYDNGTVGVFDYRAAAVAPKGILICDSGKTQTAADGTFSLLCNVPSKDAINSTGIPAISTRAVIPLKAGVAVLDPDKFEVVKKYSENVLVVNNNRFQKHLEEISFSISNFIRSATSISAECDKVIEKAEKFNVTNVLDKCESIKLNVSRIISDVGNISAQAKQLVSDINSTSLDDFKDGLSIIKDDLRGLRSDLDDARKSITSIRWESLKEVKNVVARGIGEIKNATSAIKSSIEAEKNKITDAQNQIKSLNNRIKEIKNITSTKIASTSVGAVKPVSSTNVASTSAVNSQ